MPSEMAIKGTNEFVMKQLSNLPVFKQRSRILDIGAGKGAISARLRDKGLSVSACDLSSEAFNVPDVEFRQCDKPGILPFSDGQFDMAVAVEVVEHVDGHDLFFSEVSRILKPGGYFLFTTPNILSMKSRVKFLFSGCFYSFGLLAPFAKDPATQHISPFNLNRYTWMLSQHNMIISNVTTDKIQTTSIILSFLLPVVWFNLFFQSKRNDVSMNQNSKICLLGRKLVFTAKKRL